MNVLKDRFRERVIFLCFEKPYFFLILLLMSQSLFLKR
ncbi:hypothetical protein LEP1GSC193_2723 [Leptospira alstonii serovar Pingchang str. 80-412]|uniref:Uncharacterized protein n=2 Tax=Leptospira alstonii TaxID=28452 RepID=M6CR68_9LEPT|nr:hypothetical protein LEP1GSC194_0136 [Leptospira alstonii serovar Sichuan str. 79601]EQA79194.1 hypothetical protein LEP1GSC193_2723 [Leptospira alstonii serovar Pingchang str. 80-412]